MRIKLLLIALIALSLVSGKGSGIDHTAITIVNKSGQEIAVGLISLDNSRIYYIPIPKGDRTIPSTYRFTVEEDEYRIRIYYMETYDPKTGGQCVRARTSRLLAFRNIRITVTECDRQAPTRGEPTMVKMGRWRCIY
jgi:hypothetical protein